MGFLILYNFKITEGDVCDEFTSTKGKKTGAIILGSTDVWDNGMLKQQHREWQQFCKFI